MAHTNAPRTNAPFTKEQAESINAYQKAGVFHEFTCATEDCDGVLQASEGAGLYCPQCHYTQGWVHSWVANGTWKALI